MLLMVFMAVTSCGSAELIAVSSLLTYDVYKTYVHPQASGEEVRIYGCLDVQVYLPTLCVWDMHRPIDQAITPRGLKWVIQTKPLNDDEHTHTQHDNRSSASRAAAWWALGW